MKILRSEKVYTLGTKQHQKKYIHFWAMSTNYPKNLMNMNAKEFFYLVAEMRSAQKSYFETKDPKVFRAARALENDVDREIRRVRALLNDSTDP